MKNNWFDKSLLISLLELTCETRFSFSGDGNITAADPENQAANATIQKLGLDLPILNSLRNQAIEPFLDDNLTDQDLAIFVAGYLRKSSRGEFGEFWTTIRQLFSP